MNTAQKEIVIQKLEELIELSEAYDNKALQGILCSVIGAVYAEQEVMMLMKMQPVTEKMLGKLQESKTRQN